MINIRVSPEWAPLLHSFSFCPRLSVSWRENCFTKYCKIAIPLQQARKQRVVNCVILKGCISSGCSVSVWRTPKGTDNRRVQTISPNCWLGQAPLVFAYFQVSHRLAVFLHQCFAREISQFCPISVRYSPICLPDSHQGREWMWSNAMMTVCFGFIA